MIGFLKILFYNYNNFVIPHVVVGNRRVLVLNNAHALMCDDYNYYDNCLKLNYDFDSKEFTYRDNSLLRKKLNMPKLEDFLLKEIEKYDLPSDSIIPIPKLTKVAVIDYFLPSKKELYSNINELQSIILKTKEEMETVFKDNSIYNSMILFYRKIFENSLSEIKEYKNISRKTRYSFVSSVLRGLTDFLLYDQERERTFNLSDGNYYIKLLCKK